jgi:NADH-quinone oxidoreductase subunit H
VRIDVHAIGDFLAGSSHPGAAGWYALLGLDSGFPVIAAMAIAFAIFIVLVLLPLSFAIGFADRKLTADLQARVGPNRTAGKGALQSLADFVKLGSKSDPASSSGFDLPWRRVRSAALYATFAFLPLGSTLLFFDADLGVFLPFLCFGIWSFGALMAGEGAADIDDELSAHRATFHWISAWLPALLSAAIPVVAAGSARWSEVVHAQDGGIFRWLAFSSPFGFVGLIVFLLAGRVALQLPPFQPLDLGVRRRSGEALAFRELNGFYAHFAWCVLASALFLGGADRPDGLEPSAILAIIELVTILAKAGAIVIVTHVLAKAIPQLRQDQTTDLCWKVLAPVSIVCLIGQVAWTLVFAAPIGGEP